MLNASFGIVFNSQSDEGANFFNFFNFFNSFNSFNSFNFFKYNYCCPVKLKTAYNTAPKPCKYGLRGTFSQK